MSISSKPEAPAEQATPARGGGTNHSRSADDRQLSRWGGTAALAGVIAMIGAVVTVVSLGLPDASDPETLTDFADIEGGRIAEHFFYLGALMLFAMHLIVLHRVLRAGHAAAALFGTVTAGFGYVILAASSVLHVSTSPLADLYTDPATPTEDLPAIEYAWHGAQSVFDTMLATGVLLVPIGIVLLGLAMLRSPEFGPRLARLTIGLGIIGTVGATIAIIVPGSEFSALAVLAIVVFHLSTGWRTRSLGDEEGAELADGEPTTVG